MKKIEKISISNWRVKCQKWSQVWRENVLRKVRSEVQERQKLARLSNYSWVPIKRVSLINEYRVNSKRIINEYNLINEYTGMNYDYSKQVYGQISKKNGIIPYFCKISMQNWLKTWF